MKSGGLGYNRCDGAGSQQRRSGLENGMDEEKKDRQEDAGIKNEEQDTRNAKEKLYDKIPVSLKTLDIIIGSLIAVLVIMMLYFIVRKYG